MKISHKKEVIKSKLSKQGKCEIIFDDIYVKQTIYISVDDVDLLDDYSVDRIYNHVICNY